ncbi:uncharacterized protein DNG_00896 [Cephalotrichum gorgonifer]|uniref:Uncharacterized protein n=1 Tax=Cephalotrichum gorgonifer TaxID=2041049 RepID=A0AAE8MPJ7_9PEZI|nr:uncharacterized protein DNG_00896 [Cephalotrichum gorgonifer]
MAAIAAKLAASEREADAARVRAKLKAARTARRKTELAAPMPEAAAPEAPEEQEKERDVDPVKRDQARRPDGGEQAGVAEDDVPVKRKRDKRASKVASRRRSTLSPWELESLISGNVAAAQAD